MKLWVLLIAAAGIVLLAIAVGVVHELTEADAHGGIDPGYKVGQGLPPWEIATCLAFVIASAAGSAVVIILDWLDRLAEARALADPTGRVGRHRIRYGTTAPDVDAVITSGLYGEYIPPMVRISLQRLVQQQDRDQRELRQLRALSAAMAQQLVDAGLAIPMPTPSQGDDVTVGAR